MVPRAARWQKTFSAYVCLCLHCLTHELPCAGEIIKIWSRSVHANVNIGHLWMALTKMERSDVKRELKAQIVKDCMAVKDFQFSKGSEDVQLITRRGDLLTVQVRIVKKYMKFFRFYS